MMRQVLLYTVLLGVPIATAATGCHRSDAHQTEQPRAEPQVRVAPDAQARVMASGAFDGTGDFVLGSSLRFEDFVSWSGRPVLAIGDSESNAAIALHPIERTRVGEAVSTLEVGDGYTWSLRQVRPGGVPWFVVYSTEGPPTVLALSVDGAERRVLVSPTMFSPQDECRVRDVEVDANLTGGVAVFCGHPRRRGPTRRARWMLVILGADGTEVVDHMSWPRYQNRMIDGAFVPTFERVGSSLIVRQDLSAAVVRRFPSSTAARFDLGRPGAGLDLFYRHNTGGLDCAGQTWEARSIPNPADATVRVEVLGSAGKVVELWTPTLMNPGAWGWRGAPSISPSLGCADDRLVAIAQVSVDWFEPESQARVLVFAGRPSQ